MSMTANHISDHDLERYYLGMITSEQQQAQIEKQLLWCPSCVEHAEEAQDYVDAMRVAMLSDENLDIR